MIGLQEKIEKYACQLEGWRPFSLYGSGALAACQKWHAYFFENRAGALEDQGLPYKGIYVIIFIYLIYDYNIRYIIYMI